MASSLRPSDHDPLLHPSSSELPSTNARRLKLCYLSRSKLFSVPPSQLTFSELLSLVAQAFPETDNKPGIELCYQDEEGDTVVLDSEESLALAAPTFQQAHGGVIKLYIAVKHDQATDDNACKFQTAMRPRIPCRHFQAGSCLFGSSCTFLHQASSNELSSSEPGSFIAPKPQTGDVPTSTNRQPRIPCRNFQAGSCRFGFSCTFLHQASRNEFSSTEPGSLIAQKPETRVVHTSTNRQPRIPCRHFQAGSCRFGSSCTFLHQASRNEFSTTEPGSLIAQKPETEVVHTSANRQPRIPCRHFQAGSCRFGSSCTFLHPATRRKLISNDESGAFIAESEIEEWILAQKAATEHDNISYLSSPEGYDSFTCILNHPHLPQIVMHHLVGLLTRSKFRLSMLKRATGKIYNGLIGSHFLTALPSHIRTGVKPIIGCIEPYALLCEEIMARTSGGWKEVPLDEIKTLVDEAEIDSGRELSYMIMRLLEYRTKKKRMEAVAEQTDDSSLDSLNFRDLPLIPCMEQLLSQESPSKLLPVNQVGLRYPSVAAYLDTHFRLIQEDCIATLRDGIHELRKNSRDPNLHVYTNVHLAGIGCGNEAMVFRVSFIANARHVDWQSAKRLMFGSLLCMSSDKFQTFLWAVVANRTPEHLNQNMVDIRLLEDSNKNQLEASSVYMMAESSAAYFEAYSHVLRSLQRPEMDNIPFQEHLISLEPHVKEPVYLRERNREDVYDLQCAFPLMKQELPTTQFHILQPWPEWPNSLDKSQMSALKHGLTKRLALIQGPPGTGKTFVGLLLVRIILENLKNTTAPISAMPFPSMKSKSASQGDTVGGPILVICYTNHALDQFLEGIYAYENNVVRVGGRSKSLKLEACNLQKLVRDGRHKLDMENREAYSSKKNLENDIVRCADLVNLEHVTANLLDGIATEEQVQSLFYEGCNLCSVVGMWLHERERDILNASDVERHSRRGEGTSLTHNPFNTLAMVGDASDALEGSTNEIREFDGPETVGSTGHEKSPHGGTTNHRGKLDRSEHHEGDQGEGRVDEIEPHKGKQQGDLSRHGGSNINSEGNGDNEYLQGNRFQLMYGCSYGDNLLCHEDENDDSKRGGKYIMTMVTRRDEGAAAIESADSAWTEVKTRRPQHCRAPRGANIEKIPIENEGLGVEEQVEMLKNHTDVWSLDGQARRMLHAHWIHTIRHEAQEKMTRLTSQFEEACRKKLEIKNEIQLSILRTAKVVGMTTTAAARHHSILQSLQAEVIVVEEAAEVLESHILACITASTKHLILIGDHLQLRPSVAVHKLAVKHHLDVSLFERLVKSGIEYVTLEVQRRMRPSISNLISSIYPMLKDHESVSTHENIKGIKSNVFLFHHTTKEGQTGDDESGKVNEEEAKLVVELCDYFLKQGYAFSDITILSMYRGQTQEIVRRLSHKIQGSHFLPKQNQPKLPRVSSVDDYQGEECKIIILSLVRSNSLPTAGTPGKIGFLDVSNRVCVALSRARNGLFMFGNGELLSEKSGLWASVINKLQDSGSYGDALVLTCQNHPDKHTEIRKPKDFQAVPDGGCEKPCEHQLNCGHACPKRCHPGGHEKIVCPKRCPRKIPQCDHQCQSLCHGFVECPPCRELLVKQLPRCGHSARVQCSTSIESVVCGEPCPKVLACSHECRSSCGRRCTSVCTQLVERLLPCGHSARIACHENPLTYVCPQPCQKILPDCQHTCEGTCGTCKQGEKHISCQRECNRARPCGHPCSSLCHKVCPPCFRPCQKSCIHSRCSKRCGYPCIPCVEPCGWACKHHACTQICHELCDRPCCNEPCEKLLGCGHPCLGLCGEPCPPICRICTPDFRDTISLMVMEDFDESDRFLELQDCGHVFEIGGLDTWMQTEQAESGVNGIAPKQCPECRRPITKSLRYGNHVKAKLRQIEDVKKRILAFEMTNEGIRLLREGDHGGAVQKFVTAIEDNKENFEAYFWLGSALCCQSNFTEGVHVFEFVVRHSPLASAVNGVESLKPPMKRVFAVRRVENVQAIIEKIVSCKLSTAREANKQLAVRTLVRWASALSKLGRFPEAMKLCEIVLKEEPGNEEAKETQRLAGEGKSQQREVVKAMMEEVGGRGHWYQCPNGHYYVVGECGGPMQTSVCPDCKATVGGQNHAPAAGNTHASIDGSTHSAWSNRVGLGDFAVGV